MLQNSYRSRKNFADYLRNIRVTLQLNIKDTAELTGILPHRLSDYERCKIIPTPATMRKITTSFSSLGVSEVSIKKLEDLHNEAIANSNNRVIGRIRREMS